MATTKKIASELVVSSAAAAPARRKTVSTTRKVSAVKRTASDTQASPVAAVPTAPSAPRFDDVAALAYSYWLSRGCQGGSQEDDWLRAEQELLHRAVIA